MKIKAIVVTAAFLFAGGCTVPSAEQALNPENVIIVTDSMQQAVEIQRSPQTVLALSSSIAEIWLLAGGQLKGVTSDALEGRDLGLPDNVTVLGTVKDPATESILAMKPDLVLLSPDIASHLTIADTLKQAGIMCYMSKVETLDEYLETLEAFTRITGEEESYEQSGEKIREKVNELLSRLNDAEHNKKITALFLRAYSTGVKVKANEHTVCTILDDIGVMNIAAVDGFPLEELSMEAILEADPDFIFIVPMGDEQAANASLEASLLSNPAFNRLSAVKNGNLIMLPKELYHYKPNSRWGEAYENLLKIIYPQVFDEN